MSFDHVGSDELSGVGDFRTKRWALAHRPDRTAINGRWADAHPTLTRYVGLAANQRRLAGRSSATVAAMRNSNAR